ncbi:ubiquinone biosynthesis regulatory protein kinase UbiB [Salinispirillum marinum]|uniref:Ubiquinone biosynthesis regulatory protein kinase UbiB n=2 Tax=Saccharospirillaceae TaxID=255527 RepID=A0ABV8BKN3_9GAMM
MYWLRIWRIGWLILRYRLDTLIPWAALPLWLRWLAIGAWFLPTPKTPGPMRLRLFFEALGPVFIKFGQILSTRRDLYPPEYADELARLQDKVPSFPGTQAIAVIEASLQKPITELFADFSVEPLASASIAQVHAATMHDGRAAVVKVIRPHIQKVIRKDLAWMRALAKLLARVPEARRLRPVEVVHDFEQTLLDELDLVREAANATQLRDNFTDSDLLYVPEIYWDYCHRHVLVMERIYGTSIDEIDALKAAGTDMKMLAERGVEIFFTQVFRDSFFHADMHPGNVFVDLTDPKKPRYIGIDCGIVGTMAEEDQHYLAMNLLAFFNRDYHQVARLHVESGWVPATTPIHQFEQAIRAVCEPIFARPLKEISFGLLLIRLFQVARRFDMEVQPQLVLLQKTLLNIEGLGRQLYPELDLWQTAKPYMEKWLKERIGFKRTFNTLRQQLPFLLEQAPEFPYYLQQMVKQLAKAPPAPQVRVESASNRSMSALILALAGVGLAVYGDQVAQHTLMYVGIGIALVAGITSLRRP